MQLGLSIGFGSGCDGGLMALGLGLDRPQKKFK